MDRDPTYYRNRIQRCHDEIYDIIEDKFDVSHTTKVEYIDNSNIKRVVITGRKIITAIDSLLNLNENMLNDELASGIELATCEFTNLAQKTYIRSNLDENYEIDPETFLDYRNCRSANQDLARQYNLDF